MRKELKIEDVDEYILNLAEDKPADLKVARILLRWAKLKRSIIKIEDKKYQNKEVKNND